MENLERLLELIPQFLSAGLLDYSGGNFAVRTSQGLCITPTQAAEQLHWQLSAEDFILFPGEGDASMARAGRQPSRDNRLHRAVLHARPDWDISYHGHSWGLLAFALAQQPLPVPAAHSELIKPRRAMEIPVIPEMPTNAPELTDQISEVMGGPFAGLGHGAVLLGGHGVLIAGKEIRSMLSLARTLENLARAQQWRLAAAND